MKYLYTFIIIWLSMLAFGQNHISGYEYWFDDDFSNKVSTTFSPVTQLNLNTNVSTAALNPGVHTISFRSWDQNEKFSSPLTQFFYKIPAQSSPITKQIVEYEYWYDDNYAGAVSQSVTNTQVFNLNSLISTSVLNTGIHSLSIRFKDNAQMWSSPLTQFFYKIPAQSSPITKQIVEYEYWYDDNYAGAVSQTVTNTQVFNLNSLISTSVLNTGIHSLSIRFKDNAQMWSSPLTQFFYKIPAQSSPITKQIVEYEYWYDDNYAGAVSQTVTNTQVFNLNSLISTSVLNTGIHSLSIRFKDNAQMWSSPLTQFFYKIPTSTVATKQIVKYEYWFDDDYANAIQATVGNQVIFNLSTLLTTNTLNTGVHTVSIRFQDNVEMWSSPLTQFFYKIPNTNGVANNVITHYRYWFDSDFSAAVELNLSAPVGNLNLLNAVDMTQIPHGLHSIHFQFKDSLQKWSSVTSDSIEKIALPIANFNLSINANCDSTTINAIDNSIDADTYFWDFGGVGTSTLQNPSFTFSTAGSYVVSLTVTDTILMIDSTLTTTVNVNMHTSAIWNIEECASYLSPSGLFTWTSNGTYQDTIPNATGCDSVLTINLTLNQTSSTITEVACDLYIAPDGTTYTSSGQYIAVISNSAGCDSTITINLTVNTVDATVTQNNFSYTANNNSATYQWLDCNNNYTPIAGQTGQTFTATANGSYAVEVVENGCVDTSQCFIVSTIGLFENEAFTNVSVYPNPTEGQVFMKFGQEVQDLRVELYDSQGRLLRTDFITDTDEFQLEITESRGIYFIRIISAEIKTEVKVVKN